MTYFFFAIPSPYFQRSVFAPSCTLGPVCSNACSVANQTPSNVSKKSTQILYARIKSLGKTIDWCWLVRAGHWRDSCAKKAINQLGIFWSNERWQGGKKEKWQCKTKKKKKLNPKNKTSAPNWSCSTNSRIDNGLFIRLSIWGEWMTKNHFLVIFQRN